MHYLRLLDINNYALQDRRWDGADWTDPKLAWDCCEIFRTRPEVETIAVYTHKPRPKSKPIQIHRRTPGAPA